MKFLKTYKIFESSGKLDKDLIGEIEDILELELEAKELVFVSWVGNYYPISSTSKESLIVSIQDKDKRFFSTEDIKDTITRLKTFLGEEYEIHLGIPRDLVYGEALEFIDDFRGEELYDLTIYIYKKYND
jgi:hypothetical protein